MVQTAAPKSADKPQDYLVLRPFWLQGERVEIGEIVSLIPVLGSELASANKVASYNAKAQAQAEAAALQAAKTAQAEAEALAAQADALQAAETKTRPSDAKAPK